MGRPSTDKSGQIQRGGGGGKSQSLSDFILKDLGPQIRLALPRHLDGDRMARIALTAMRTNPDLGDCDRFSFAACILQAAQLGLEVNTPLGHAYLIPRNKKGADRKEVTLQIGYQGMIDLARRSGQVSSIYAFTVHTGDEFSYELGLDPKLKHVPEIDAEQDEKTMTFVYAVAKLKGDEADRQFVVLSKKAVNDRKARGAGGPAWRTDYLAMAKKTAVRALFTWLPKSPEMARATTIDDGEVLRKPTATIVDASVIEQLDTLALPAPDHDPETGEVPEDQEPTDEQLGKEG